MSRVEQSLRCLAGRLEAGAGSKVRCSDRVLTVEGPRRWEHRRYRRALALYQRNNSRTFDDFPDDAPTGRARNLPFMLLRHDQDHSDAHVENLIHFRRADIPTALDDGEDRRDSPGTPANIDLTVRWQHPGQIVHESSSGDVSRGVDHPRFNGGHRRLIVLVHAQ